MINQSDLFNLTQRRKSDCLAKVAGVRCLQHCLLMKRKLLNPWEDDDMKLKAALLGAAAVALFAGAASAADLACLIT